MKNVRNIGFALVGSVLLLASQAHAAIDLTPVTDELTALKVAVLAAAGVAITGGLALAAIKFGGTWLKSVFKRMSS